MQLGAQSALSSTAGLRQLISSALANPAVVLFLSANIVNVGNLAFNVLFSRWLGPELFSDLALLLTVKLSILCLLSAVQFEIAGRAARSQSAVPVIVASHKTNRLLRNSVFASLLLLVLGAATAFLLLPESLGQSLFDDERTLAYGLFALCLPFAAPLCMARGLSQGTLQLKYLVLSAQVEMGVRFIGAGMAWFLGAGLPGIALAIALSIILGWWFAAPPVNQLETESNANTNSKFCAPTPPSHQARKDASIIERSLLWAALPWGMLQLGQIIALDGDFLAIKMFYSAEESGLAAVAVLIQRILFFGCFGLASAILPMAAAAKTKQDMIQAMLPVIALLAVTIVPFIALMTLFPAEIVTLVFGENYRAAAPSLVYSSVSGASFVIIYLIATFLVAQQRSLYGFLVIFGALAIAAILLVVAALFPDAGIMLLIQVKAMLLTAFALIFTGIAWNEFSRIESSKVP